MTLATFIDADSFGALLGTAFAPEVPAVVSSESELGQPLQRFGSIAEILAKVAQCRRDGFHDYAFALWYPSMKGAIVERRIELDPPRDGHGFRHSLGGWGLIHLHLYFPDGERLQCRVVVNSEARARAREARYPELGPVAAWDWPAVERHAYKLTRRLSTMGPTAPVVARGAPKSPPARGAGR